MKFHKTPIALAAFALFAAAPFAAQGAPTSNAKPVVTFTKPANNANLPAGPVACTVTATDSDGIKQVQWFLDGKLINTESGAPYDTCNVNTRGLSGAHVIKAVATDKKGGIGEAQVTINVGSTTTNPPPVVTNPAPVVTNPAPVVTFTKPANNANLAPGAVACTVTATDSDGIKQVQWFLDGKLINTESSAPYDTCNVNTTGLSGAHVIKAVATDKKGGIGEAQVTVNVGSTTTNPPPVVTNPAPVVTFTKPANGATLPTSGPVSCVVTASDADGIKQVQWFLDGKLINTESSAPYDTCNVYNLPAGAHVIKAVATDNKGGIGEAQISVNAGTASTPPPVVTNPAPVVTFTKPANNANLAPGAVACTVTATDSDGVKQVQWFLDGKLINTESLAPYDTCNVNTTGLSGAHVIKAVATDNKGVIGEAQITVNVGSTTTNTPPTVSLSAPSTGSSLSGTAVPYQASASDTGGSVAKVEFVLVPSTQTATTSSLTSTTTSTPTPVATHTTAPYQGTFDSTKHPNGGYTLMAVATDNLGAIATTQRDVTISNVAPTPTPTPTPTPDPTPAPGTGTSLPSTNAKSVATFESLGVYWKPASAPSDGSCTVRYRKASESEFKEGLPLWFDPRNSECRGSIVHLAPGTDYVVEMGLTGQQPVAGLNTKTWSENFPIAQTIQVQSGSGTLNITQGGTPSGYVLYTGPATLDANDAVDFNVTISAPYVIVRGLTLKGARRDAIRILKPAHDVVIEDNDISEWGRWSGTTSVDGWKVQTDGDSGIAANCWGTEPWLERTIIQRNKIHHPRYGSNSWSGTVGLSNKHPKGANAVFINDCGGNHVFRHNEVYSDWGRYFMDGYGGWENFSSRGTPNSDSDIYGNIIKHVWDDAIEAEGANMNVRIWGNYMDQTATAIATTSTVKGPVYIFRNVWNRSRNLSKSTLDADSRLYMFKSGSTSGGDGRRYVLHNTMLQAPPPAGSTLPLGGGQGLAGPGGGQNLTNTVSRNNVFHIWKSWWTSISDNGGGGTPNNLDYDLVNGGVSAYAGAEANRIVGTPIYQAGHGWQSEAGGNYQLAPNSPGYDRGTKLPNFNDAFSGAAPDMGAHEAGTPAMRLGVNGAGSTSAGTTGDGTTTTTTTTTTESTSSTSGTTTTTTSGGGVCSTVWCAATQ